MKVLFGSSTSGDRQKDFMPVLFIYMVMIAGTVEDERLFSAVNFVCQGDDQKPPCSEPRTVHQGNSAICVHKENFPVC